MEARTSPCQCHRGLRYPSDLSDAEWVLVAPLIPPARRVGRSRSINEREGRNAIFYVLVTGCQWQALPKDLLPKSTAHFCFQLWDSDGTLDRIHEAPYVAVREAAGREASPNDAIIDSQSAKAAQKGLIGCSSGLRCGKKVTGRERHILVDTLGLLLGVSVLPANIQDRDGARDLLQRARRRFPFIERIFADAGYRGPKMAKIAAATGSWHLEIVKRSDLHCFVVLPKRWIVKRTFAWISRNRRVMRDFECYDTTVAAFVRLAMIRLMLKRLTKPSLCS